MNIYIYLGTLQSYNFAGGQHLANQDYSMCIREAIKIERIRTEWKFQFRILNLQLFLSFLF